MSGSGIMSVNIILSSPSMTERPFRSFTRSVFPKSSFRMKISAMSFTRFWKTEDLDEKAQEKLEKEFATEMEIIKRDDRLETIAKGYCTHFPTEGIWEKEW